MDELGSAHPSPKRIGAPRTRSVPSAWVSKMRSMVLGELNRCPCRVPEQVRIDWLRATDRAFPCPLTAPSPAGRQTGSVVGLVHGLVTRLVTRPERPRGS